MIPPVVYWTENDKQWNMEPINKDILQRCKDGDKDAFRLIVKQYQRLVFSLALKMLCDEEEAKDTVQDTFIRVWQNIDE